jgi:hypothetical protein
VQYLVWLEQPWHTDIPRAIFGTVSQTRARVNGDVSVATSNICIIDANGTVFWLMRFIHDTFVFDSLRYMWFHPSHLQGEDLGESVVENNPAISPGAVSAPVSEIIQVPYSFFSCY